MLPVSRFPALKARKVLRLLYKVGYVQVRQSGSHRKLEAEGRAPIFFAFHDGVEVPPAALRHMLAKQARLSDDEILEVL